MMCYGCGQGEGGGVSHGAGYVVIVLCGACLECGQGRGVAPACLGLLSVSCLDNVDLLEQFSILSGVFKIV